MVAQVTIDDVWRLASPDIGKLNIRQPDAEDIIGYAMHPTNTNRTQLRIWARHILNALGEPYKANISTVSGKSIAKMIDSLSYGALVDIVAGAAVSKGKGLNGDLCCALKRLYNSHVDPLLCHPKQRGSGPSLGYHIDCIEGQAAATMIDAAWTTTTATTTATAAKEKKPMNNTTIDYNQAVAVIAACSDILGLDTRSAVFDTLLGMTNQLGWDRNDKTPMMASVHQQAQDDNLTTVDDLDDEMAALVQEITLKLKGIAHTKGNAAPAVATPTIDPSLRPAVDALLKQASNGALVSIDGLIQQHAQSLTEIATLGETIERLKASAASAPASVAKSGRVQVNAATLTYEVVMKRASKLFPAPDGSEAKALGFELPTLVWKDDSGNVVQHPDCPDVDANYQFRLRHLVKFLTAFRFGKNIWLHGHTGTGKTTLAEQIAARLGFPVGRLNLDGFIERSDMVGSTEIKVKDGAPVTEFREGILPKAMQQPCMFILDEIDGGRPDALFVIQRALESKGLTLTEDGGRTVQPHELFRFVATGNSRGQGDEHGWYQGVRPMNLAMLNRFGAFIEVPYLDRDDERRLIEGAYPALKKQDVEELTQFAVEVRQAFTTGEISQTLSPRGLMAMCEFYQAFSEVMDAKTAMREAVEMVVIDSAPSDCEQRLRELQSRVFS